MPMKLTWLLVQVGEQCRNLDIGGLKQPPPPAAMEAPAKEVTKSPWASEVEPADAAGEGPF
jgi:hypothetical protein